MEYVNIPGGVQDGSCIGDYVTECINPQDVQDYQGAGLTKGSDIIFMSRCGLPPKFLSVWLEGSGKEINLNESARRCANLFSAALEWGDHAIVMELFREGPHDGIAGGDINCYLDIIRCWSEAKARWVTAGSHASAKAISMHIKAGVTVREVDSPNGWVPFSDYGLEMLIALRNASKPPR